MYERSAGRKRILKGGMVMNSKGKGRENLRNFTKDMISTIARISVIGTLSILILFAYGISNSTAAEKAPKAPYVIGGIVSTTGGHAYWGTQLAEGEAFTAKLWNEKGGIKGYPIKYVPGDDECKPDRALTITKMLVTKDNVLAIVAGGLTACVTAMSPYLNQVGVPFIFSAGGKTYNLPQEKFMFGVLPNTPIVIDYKLNWLKKKGITKVALIGDNTAYGEENAVYIPGAAKRLGVDLAALERYNLEDIDVTPMLSRLKAKNPGGVISASNVQGSIRCIKQMLQIGFDVPTLLPVSHVDNIFIKNLGEAAMRKTNVYADGNYLMTLDDIPDTDPKKIKAKGFVQAFEKEYGKKFNYGNGVGYDKMETVLRAIQAVAPPADKIDYKNADQLKKIREDIRNWIENAKGLDLLLGTYNRSPEDHIGTRDVGMVRIVDGKWITVE
jgi:branched-chain amino acid transport system substrate-binding protein